MNLNNILGRAISGIVSHKDLIVSVTKQVKDLFGKTKTGSEKLQISKDIVAQIPGLVGVAEDVTNKDLVNDPALSQLLTEATQLGYDVVQLEETIAAKKTQIDSILAKIKTLKGTGQPIDPTQ